MCSKQPPEPAVAPSGRLCLPARIAQLDVAKDFLARVAASAGLDARQCGRLELALEEVFVNICHYAYADGEAGEIELRAHLDGERFVVDLLDDGEHFDPLRLPQPDLEAGLGQRSAGGLGWFLTRQMVHELHCQRLGGRNLVSLVVLRGGSDPQPTGSAESWPCMGSG